MGIHFNGTREVCKTVIGGASMDLYIYIGAVALLALASIVFTLVFKPRPVIQVVVRCGDVIDHCVEAAERVIKRLRR